MEILRKFLETPREYIKEEELVKNGRRGAYKDMTGNYVPYLGKQGWFLYVITNKQNGTIYIGTTKNIRHRMITYYWDAFSSAESAKYKEGNRQIIIKAIRKYQFINFDFMIIAGYHTEEEMYLAEIEGIKFIRDNKIRNYNICPGGANSFDPINFRKGLESPRSVLTLELINEIFKLYHEEKMTCTKIHQKLNILNTIVKNILNAKTYKEITQPLVGKYGKIRSSVESRKITPRENQNLSSKLEIKNTFEIIDLFFEKNKSIKEIAILYNVVPSTIEWVLNGGNWFEITEKILMTYLNHPKNKLKLPIKIRNRNKNVGRN